MTRARDPSQGTRLDHAVEWVLSVVSPRRAAARRHLRRFEHDLEYRDAFSAVMRARGYRAARSDATQTPWSGVSRSADGEIILDLYALRARSRELARDDPIGCGLFKSFESNVVGARGLDPQADTGDPDKNDRIEEVWDERKHDLYPGEGRLSYAAGQRLIYRRARLEDGEILLVASVDPADPQGPLGFELVEADRIGLPQGFPVTSGTTWFANTAKGNVNRNGVERTLSGRIVAYHVNRYHPGDTLPPVTAAVPFSFERIPVERCYHLYRIERPGQSRGVPLCHAVLQDIHDLDLLLLASLKRTQIAACLAVFVSSPQPMENLFDVTAETYGYKLDQNIEPGMIFKLHPGETVDTLSPNFPTPELAPFIVQLARRIGAAVGVSWQTVLRDFSQSTYSSARTDLLETWQTYEIDQVWFSDCLAWQRFLVLEREQLRGDRRLQGCTPVDFMRAEWIPPGRRWVDPRNEASATQIELEIGITTKRDVCAARGQDWQRILRQRLEEEKAERDLREELGLPSPEEIENPQPPAPEPAPQNGDGNGTDARALGCLRLLRRATNGAMVGVGAGAREFDESKHPRDDDGKWTAGAGTGDAGGGGESGSGESGKSGDSGDSEGGKSAGLLDASGRPTEAVKKRLRALGMHGTMPPAAAYDIWVSDELDQGAEHFRDKLLMTWKQVAKESGRVSSQSRYTKEFHDLNAGERWELVKTAEPHIDKLRDSLREKVSDASANVRERHAAAIAAIIAETGLRPTDGATSVKHGHFGIASLRAEHVTFEGDTARLDFIGKEGVRNQTTVTDPANVAALREAHAAAGEGKIWKADSDRAGRVLKSVAAGIGAPEDLKLKDLRTIKATQVAREVTSTYAGPPPPLTGSKGKDGRVIKAAILKMAGVVAKVLNNTPAMARDNYVHPEVWREWQSRLVA